MLNVIMVGVTAPRKQHTCEQFQNFDGWKKNFFKFFVENHEFVAFLTMKAYLSKKNIFLVSVQ
jgi:hypothetical protein